MIDKFGRNINYLRISLTDECNLKCVYCTSEDDKLKTHYNKENLSFEDFKFIIKAMSDLGVTKVRFTGGEPLMYPKLNELIRFTREECNIEDIGITTNGTNLCEIIHGLKESGLKNVNISVDSLKEFKYKTLTRGGALKNVLESINMCLKLGIDVKINCVVIDGFNDDEIYDFILMTNYYPIDIKFLELMPIGEGEKLYKKAYYDIKKTIQEIDEIYQVKSNEKCSDNYYEFKGAKGRIGIVAPLRNLSCKNCNEISITSYGMVKLCPYSGVEIDVNQYMQKPLIFREIMKEIVLNKPEYQCLI